MLLDIIAALLLVAACIKGMRQGLVGSVFSLLAWLIGLVAALKLSAVVATRISEYGTSARWIPLLAFLAVFILVAFLVNMGGRLISSVLDTVMLGWANKLGGMLFYSLLYACIYSVILFYAVQLNLVTMQQTGTSVAYPLLAPVAPAITEGLGSVIPVFKNIFGQLEAFFSAVSNKMQH
ncbi:MAG: CvpA family protein [Ferruginibacter sp.]